VDVFVEDRGPVCTATAPDDDEVPIAPVQPLPRSRAQVSITRCRSRWRSSLALRAARTPGGSACTPRARTAARLSEYPYHGSAELLPRCRIRVGEVDVELLRRFLARETMASLAWNIRGSYCYLVYFVAFKIHTLCATLRGSFRRFSPPENKSGQVAAGERFRLAGRDLRRDRPAF
jgi:hypothetical protein